MIVITKILGNLNDEKDWRSQLEGAEIDLFELTEWETQKSRFRKTTSKGQDLGIFLDRNQLLKEGDILLWDETQKRALIVKVHLREVLVLQAGIFLDETSESLLKISFELGNLFGNLHWKSLVKGAQIFIPLSVSRRIMENIVKTHVPDLPYQFLTGEQVVSKLSAAEVRLLFGGADTPNVHVSLNPDFQIQRCQ
ncbi:urease accessory protein UreE [Acetobacteraceae bacterium]|nr:urease accessory protein UreE [Acetobacteraceae bacterium]